MIRSARERRIPAAFILLLLATLLAAAGHDTTITVTVKSEHDRPLDNAAVIVDFLGSHQLQKLGKRKPIHWEVHTNQQGVARFPPVPQGIVQVQVIAKDYQTFGDKYDIDTEDRKIDISLNRPQKQYSAHPPLPPSNEPKK
jgi:hypothetical protein